MENFQFQQNTSERVLLYFFSISAIPFSRRGRRGAHYPQPLAELITPQRKPALPPPLRPSSHAALTPPLPLPSSPQLKLESLSQLACTLAQTQGYSPYCLAL